MGLFTKENLTEDWAVSMADIPRLCFLCAEPLSMPCIFWMGCSDTNQSKVQVWGAGRAQIWLHPKCASIFATKLTTDWLRYYEQYERKP